MYEPDSEQDENRGRTRTTKGDERRRALVQAAYHLIAEKGFEQLRTRDVAARAGVNIATLHYYFASKEDLIRGVVDYLLHQFRTAPTPSTGMDDSTPLSQVRTMFLMTHARFQAAPEMFTVMSELVLRSSRDASMRLALQWLDNQWHAYLTSVITDGVQQGMFRADLDPARTATTLIMLIKGFFYHQITSPGAIDSEYILNNIEHLLLP
ncbi:MAG: TetR/AcrR family transcriptional regulator [Chloroflexi bacterium]|nr:TetR/AcrR family transcriptional regulator [Chloroflexota bacterium]